MAKTQARETLCGYAIGMLCIIVQQIFGLAGQPLVDPWSVSIAVKPSTTPVGSGSVHTFARIESLALNSTNITNNLTMHI
jgi:hypothetical protein